MASIRSFLSCESGATAIEYGLIASLIAVACIAAISLFGSKMAATFDYATSKMRTS